MEIREIENYLSTKNTQINNSVGEAIEEHRNRFILAKDEAQANYCWCLRQIYRIQNKYVSAINALKNKNYEDSWCILEQIEIELSSLEENFDITVENDKYHMVFISRMTSEYQKLFPYCHFFSGLIRCADCGSNMSYHTNTVNKDIHYFSCSNYIKDTRGTCPERHYIRADALEQIVILELKRLAIMLQKDEALLADILEKKTNKDFYDEKKFLEGELQKAIVRQQMVATLYENLYEDNATGKVTDEWFTHMSHKYEVERTELKVKIFNLREQVANMQTVQHSKDMFIGAVRKFLDMETITAPLIHELIDHIDVYEAEGKGNVPQAGYT